MAWLIFRQSSSVKPAVAHLARVDPGLGAEQALGQLELAHLQREEQHGPVGLERGVGGHAEGEARLARCRGGRRRRSARSAAGPDSELVEVDVAGGHAGDGLAPLVELLEAVEVLVEQVVEQRHRVGDPPLGDLEHQRLGPVDGLGDVVGHVVAELGDLAGHADQPAEQRVLLDDLGVARRRSSWPGVAAWRLTSAAGPPMASSRPARRSSSATVTGSTGSPAPTSDVMAS